MNRDMTKDTMDTENPESEEKSGEEGGEGETWTTIMGMGTFQQNCSLTQHVMLCEGVRSDAQVLKQKWELAFLARSLTMVMLLISSRLTS